MQIYSFLINNQMGLYLFCCSLPFWGLSVCVCHPGSRSLQKVSVKKSQRTESHCGLSCTRWEHTLASLFQFPRGALLTFVDWILSFSGVTPAVPLPWSCLMSVVPLSRSQVSDWYGSPGHREILGSAACQPIPWRPQGPGLSPVRFYRWPGVGHPVT